MDNYLSTTSKEAREQLDTDILQELGVLDKPEPKVISIDSRPRVLNFTITDCNRCPMRGIDGGPGPACICTHPEAPDYGYIVNRDQEGFPKKCPLELFKGDLNSERLNQND